MKSIRKIASTAVLGLATFAYAGTALAQTELDFWSWRQEDVKATTKLLRLSKNKILILKSPSRHMKPPATTPF